MRRSARFAAANMGQGRRSRRLRLGCPRRAVRAFGSLRPEKARQRRRLAEVPNTHMKRVRANESPDAGRAFLGRSSAPSSVSRAARRPAQRCRSRRDAPPRDAPPHPVRPQPARRQRQRARRAALRQQKKPPGPERVVVDSAPLTGRDIVRSRAVALARNLTAALSRLRRNIGSYPHVEKTTITETRRFQGSPCEAVPECAKEL